MDLLPFSAFYRGVVKVRIHIPSVLRACPSAALAFVERLLLLCVRHTAPCNESKRRLRDDKLAFFLTIGELRIYSILVGHFSCVDSEIKYSS